MVCMIEINRTMKPVVSNACLRVKNMKKFSVLNFVFNQLCITAHVGKRLIQRFINDSFAVKAFFLLYS